MSAFLFIKRIASSPWTYGVVGFLGCRWALGRLFDLSYKCEDGWRSGSIGTQGACSHHGGIDGTASGFAFFGSALFGLLIVILIKKISSGGVDPHHSKSEAGYQKRVVGWGVSPNNEPVVAPDEQRPQLTNAQLLELKNEMEVQTKRTADFVASQLAKTRNRSRR